MKKILFAFALVAGFSAASYAQSNQKSSAVADEPAKVEVAGQVANESVATESATTISGNQSSAKACCSSKKGKETASAGSKSCCADGKKSKAHCAEMKEEATPNN